VSGEVTRSSVVWGRRRERSIWILLS